jgi:Cft2 family RNA processing exonuclease
LHDDCVCALALAVQQFGHRSEEGAYQTARTASYAPRRTHP